jgi:hypothetical protein
LPDGKGKLIKKSGEVIDGIWLKGELIRNNLQVNEDV